jgi:hypothetical protein
MTYLIIADWDESFHITRTNNVATEVEAQALVNRLINELPEAQRAPNAFYAEMPAEGTNIKYIIVDPSAKTVTYNTSQETTDKIAKSFEQLRQERELKLIHSDWVSSKATDTGTAVPDDWKTYKQALRDFPATVDINDWPNVTWPMPPS